MPRKTTGKAGRIDQSRDPFVIKVNREDVKFETSVLCKSPSHLLLQNPAGKAKTGNENMFCFSLGGGGHNYCLNTNSLDWLVRAT